MSADDLVAIGWISVGAVVSSAITLGVYSAVSAPSVPVAQPKPVPAPIHAPAAPRSVIDFAIIREEVETMVGPEGPETGWAPPPTPNARPPR
jgi:hypothetical protein